MPAIMMIVDIKYAWAESSGKMQSFGANVLFTKIIPPTVVTTFYNINEIGIIGYTVAVVDVNRDRKITF